LLDAIEVLELVREREKKLNEICDGG